MTKRAHNAVDLTGMRFGRLRVKEFSHSGNRRSFWLCICDCGTEKVIERRPLRSGHSRSCGCLERESKRLVPLKHGMSRDPIYFAWKTMRARCEKPSHVKFKDYGARGVRVCDRWQRFENFYADMGPRPSPIHSVDRIDVNGNYEPTNCRWATPKEQMANRRDTRRAA